MERRHRAPARRRRARDAGSPTCRPRSRWKTSPGGTSRGTRSARAAVADRSTRVPSSGSDWGQGDRSRSRPPTSRPTTGRPWGSGRRRARTGCSGPPGGSARSRAARARRRRSSSAGTIRMQCSGQMSTQPPHRMQMLGSSLMFRKHCRQRPASRRACSSRVAELDLRRADAALGRPRRAPPRGCARCSRGVGTACDRHDGEHAAPGERRAAPASHPSSCSWIEAAARLPSAIASIRLRGPNATSPPA